MNETWRMVLLASIAFLIDPGPGAAQGGIPGGNSSTDAAFTVSSLFRSPELGVPSLSPRGEYIAFMRRTGTKWRLVVMHPVSEAWTRIQLTTPHHTRFEWADDSTLIVQTADQNALVRVQMGDGKVRTRAVILPKSGVIVDPMRQEDDRFLLGIGKKVYRVAVRSNLKRLEAGRPPLGHVVATHPENVVHWVPDARGVVRAAVSTVESGEDILVRLWVRENAKAEWQLVTEWELALVDLEWLWPLGFTSNGERLLVITNRDRDRNAVYEMDPLNGELVELVYEHPTAEIEEVVFDSSGQELIGVAAFEGGLFRLIYFDETIRRHQRMIEAALPGQRVWLYEMNRDENVFVVLAAGARHRGSYYVYDSEARHALEVGSIAPWLSDELTNVEAFFVESSDGLRVESFYTQPRYGTVPHPLVVMPHGGPIGVRDGLEFDPVSQFLAFNGFAVLRVNYRGSAGYGRAFERAGHGEWGRGIEDDIDAAVDHVVEQGWADPERMVLFGASYGGYSALMSAIRHPRRYRCAITWMGVSDLPLRMANSKIRASQLVNRAMTRIVGEPEARREDLIRRSPVYRAGEIRIPVMIIHGDRDSNVDVEHAYRLKLALEKYGNEPVWKIMEGYGHAMPDEEAAIQLFRDIRRFLWDHRDPDSQADAAL